jgi:hypothetical protein
MQSYTLDDVLALPELEAKKEGKEWRCLCPLHKGHSLHVKAGTTQPWLAVCRGGCSKDKVFRALCDLLSKTRSVGKRSPVENPTPEPVKATKFETAPWSKWKTLSSAMYQRIVEMRARPDAGYMPKFETLLAFDFREYKGMVGFPVGLPSDPPDIVDCIRYFAPKPHSKVPIKYDGTDRDSSRLFMFRMQPGVGRTREQNERWTPDITDIKQVAATEQEEAFTHITIKEDWKETLQLSGVEIQQQQEPLPWCNSFFVVEGIWDTLALWELGYKGAGLQCSGQPRIHPEFLRQMEDSVVVFLMTDNDAAGEQSREKVFPMLPKGASFNITYPNTKDLCSLLAKKYDPTALDEAITYSFTVANRRKFAEPEKQQAPIPLPYPRREITVIDGDTVNDAPMHFIWPKRIPRSALTVICGVQDSGKGILISNIVATLTTKRDWLDSKNENPAMSVLYMSAEDSYKYTVVPRLKAAGANMKNVKFVTGAEDITDNPRAKSVFKKAGCVALNKDLEALREVCSRLKIGAVIIDPISSYLGREIRQDNVSDVRSVLDPLQQFAEDTDVPVIAIGHFNKNETQKVINRLAGSHAFSACPRAVWIVGRNPELPTERFFVCQKCNALSDEEKRGFIWKPVAKEHTYSTGEKGGVPVVEYLGASALTAEQACSETPRETKQEGSAEFVKKYLADGNWHESDEGLNKAAIEANFALRTFREATSELRKDGVIQYKPFIIDGTKTFYVRLVKDGFTPPAPTAKHEELAQPTLDVQEPM